jgi:hypothetical protein
VIKQKRVTLREVQNLGEDKKCMQNIIQKTLRDNLGEVHIDLIIIQVMGGFIPST